MHTDGGARGRAITPSGASRGRFEAWELRDGDPRRFQGKGVEKAIRNARETVAPALVGQDVTDQERIDQILVELDGSPNRERLGGNTLLAVSLACAHAAAAATNQPLYAYLGEPAAWQLPLPMINIISGGLHAGTGLTVQDFMIIPYGANSLGHSLEMASAIRSETLNLLQQERGYAQLVADEGGFGPELASNREALALLVRACERAGHRPGEDVGIAVDVAATHLQKDEGYALEPNQSALTPAEVVEHIVDWSKEFPVVSVEDALAEEDWEGWRALGKRLRGKLQLVGDDLFVTNLERLERGIREKVANAILIKPNQIGTLTETLKVLRRAKEAGFGCIVSARSGETEDSTIADLAVATGAGQIKIGSLARSSRLAKYNQLLRIEEEIGTDRFAGREPLRAFLPWREGE